MSPYAPARVGIYKGFVHTGPLLLGATLNPTSNTLTPHVPLRALYAPPPRRVGNAKKPQGLNPEALPMDAHFHGVSITLVMLLGLEPPLLRKPIYQRFYQMHPLLFPSGLSQRPIGHQPRVRESSGPHQRLPRSAC